MDDKILGLMETEKEILSTAYDSGKSIEFTPKDCYNLLVIIAALEAQLPRWISVEERLPEYGKAVLIMTTTSVLPRIGRHSPTIPQWATTDLLYYHDISYSQVTHWMSLPSAPESEDE